MKLLLFGGRSVTLLPHSVDRDAEVPPGYFKETADVGPGQAEAQKGDNLLFSF